MKKYINGKLQEVITEKDHNTKCKYTKFVEITKADSEEDVLIVKYKFCPKCRRYISGGKYNLNKDHY